MRYTDWARIRFTQGSDPDAAAALIPQGRKLLGELMQALELGGQPTGIVRKPLPDGSTLTAHFDGTTPIIDIDVPGTVGVAPAGALFNLWLPRGFVVFPAWQDAPAGVGLPVKQVDGGRYAPANLAPGAGRTRWTPGGPCGDVLISKDTDAGYTRATDIQVPLLYQSTKGPVLRWNGSGVFDARPYDGSWSAYRMEFTAPVAHYSDESAANVAALLDAANALRTQHNLPTLTMDPRGYYNGAEVMVSIMQAAGSTDAKNSGYPITYRTPAQRLTKDGFSAPPLAATPTWARDDNPSSWELRHLGGPDDAVQAWAEDTDDAAALLKDIGVGAFGSAGFRGGYCALDVIRRERWIGAGNVSWQSSDPELPILSWHGFASLNLAWETLPAVFDPYSQTTPIVLREQWQPGFPGFTDTYGNCWMNYPRQTLPTDTAHVEPALERVIYCRGRAIARAPHGGLVWAAGVAANGASDRLIALIHHPQDQQSDAQHQGYTRYLRVWWADIPKRDHLRLDPQLPICGADADDPWAWRGGQMLDVGAMPPPSAGFSATPADVTSLKYASAWRFSADGLHAICMRDYGSLLDYTGFYDGLVTGINPRAVEIGFSISATTLGAQLTFHDYTAGRQLTWRVCNDRPLPKTSDSPDEEMLAFPAVPSAVDFSLSGDVIYAFFGSIASTFAGRFDGLSSPRVDYVYAGTGDAATAYVKDMQHMVLAGCEVKTPSVNRITAGHLGSVIDVRDAVFALQSSRPWYGSSELLHITGPSTFLDPPCQSFTDAPVFGVRLCRAGVVLSDDWYPSPDGAVIDFYQARGSGVGTNETPRRAFFAQAQSALVQGYYARRGKDYVLSYVNCPVPGVAFYFQSPPDDPTYGCLQTMQDLESAAPNFSTPVRPRGGRSFASLPLPDNDWLFYAKVV